MPHCPFPFLTVSSNVCSYMPHQGDTAGDAFSGFVIATATKQSITYDFYRLAYETQGLSPNATSKGYIKAFTSVSNNWKKKLAPSCTC